LHSGLLLYDVATQIFNPSTIQSFTLRTSLGRGGSSN
jgi:hypothetical protein